ncbi:MAG: TetR/AcrR family transcriptional regulator [Candidatus Latescibacterota bacterium]|nr:MAG: TetR/AcrR family transcriptional regulator [Candidatus Latescibacterota bacterium]
MEKANFRRAPKQARSRERYKKILDTAANLFFEKGFDGATTNEIAHRAGISIGSLYQYFDNKEAIVAALTDRYVEALKDVTVDVITTDVEDLPTAPAVDRLLDPILKFHSAHPEFRPLWLGAEVSQELKDSMQAMDDEVVRRVGALLEARAPKIPRERARMVVTVMHLGLKSLLGLFGRSDTPRLKALAAAEMKRMFTAYVDQVIREQES